MSTQAPSARGLIALGVFALSCFGLTLYMWLIFGGSSPLEPRGYRMTVAFPDAGGLTNEADVRIAGVNVGKVKARRVDARRKVTIAELEINAQFAPRPADTHAVLRQKTVLGETYVQLSAGTPSARKLPDGGHIDEGAVAPTVRLDDLLRTFDPATRRALATWLTGQGGALRDEGPALSAALAQLEPLGRYGNDFLAILRRQDKALGALVRDGGDSLAALTERRGALRSLVSNSERVFRTTATRDEALADAFRVFPTFLRETRATVTRLSAFSVAATPLVVQLQPSGRALEPVLRDTNALAPDLERLFGQVRPLEVASRTAVPALETALDETVPWLGRLKPYLGTLIPIVDYLGAYQREITGFLGNLAAATQATLPAIDGVSGPRHYIRGSVPINIEALTAYPARPGTNRSNAYPAPGSYLELFDGLSLYDGRLCTGRPAPTLSDAFDPVLRAQIEGFYFTDNPNGPACKAQAPLGATLGAGGGSFPRLRALP